MADTPICPYCEQPSVLIENSARLYHGRDYGPAYVCTPCSAWVACHPGTICPLGRLANAELRQAKRAAHSVFDPLWQRKMEREGLKQGQARRKGYRWLAAQLGIDSRKCHIGMFDVETCNRVVELCKPFADRLRTDDYH